MCWLLTGPLRYRIIEILQGTPGGHVALSLTQSQTYINVQLALLPSSKQIPKTSKGRDYTIVSGIYSRAVTFS